MGGLAKICKLYGGMTATSTRNGKTKTVAYVYDYANDEVVKESVMKPGSERHKNSERAKWDAFKKALEP